jgi:hypothetical protein
MCVRVAWRVTCDSSPVAGACYRRRVWPCITPPPPFLLPPPPLRPTFRYPPLLLPLPAQVLQSKMLAELKKRQFTQLPVIDCRTMTALKGWSPMKISGPVPVVSTAPDFQAQMQAQAQWVQQQQQQQAVPALHPAQMQAHVTAKINQVNARFTAPHTSRLTPHTSHLTHHPPTSPPTHHCDPSFRSSTPTSSSPSYLQRRSEPHRCPRCVMTAVSRITPHVVVCALCSTP